MIKKLREILNEGQYLYHATYEPHMDKIKKEGLHGNSGNKNYDDSKKGVLYLAKNADVARSYAETSDSVPEHYLDKIKVLKVHKQHLEKTLLKKDSNVQGSSDTMEYHGTVPFHHLKDSDND